MINDKTNSLLKWDRWTMSINHWMIYDLSDNDAHKSCFPWPRWKVRTTGRDFLGIHSSSPHPVEVVTLQQLFHRFVLLLWQNVFCGLRGANWSSFEMLNLKKVSDHFKWGSWRWPFHTSSCGPSRRCDVINTSCWDCPRKTWPLDSPLHSSHWIPTAQYARRCEKRTNEWQIDRFRVLLSAWFCDFVAVNSRRFASLVKWPPLRFVFRSKLGRQYYVSLTSRVASEERKSRIWLSSPPISSQQSRRLWAIRSGFVLVSSTFGINGFEDIAERHPKWKWGHWDRHRRGLRIVRDLDQLLSAGTLSRLWEMVMYENCDIKFEFVAVQNSRW